MKRKIIALMMATVSAVSLFAACGETGECSAHTDSDKNKVCDSCGRAIVYVTEYLPPEEEPEVPMVVKPLPTEANRSDYFLPMTNNAAFDKTKLTEKDGLVSVGQNGTFNRVHTIVNNEDPENVTNENIIGWYKGNGETIYEFTTGAYPVNDVTYWKDATVETKDGYRKFVETRYTDHTQQASFQIKTKIFTAYGETLINADNEWSELSDYTVGGIRYLEFYSEVDQASKAFALNAATGKLMYAYGEDEYVQTVPFTKVQGDKGYIFGTNTLWIYDLSAENWMDLTYYKTFSSTWTDRTAYVLENGNVLVQASKRLAADSVNYDYAIGEKYDLMHVIIDAATGTETEVEFGYKIQALDVASDEVYTDAAKNIATFAPIVDHEIDMASAIYNAVLDNELNILYVAPETLPGISASKVQVAEGLYQATLSYDNGSSCKVLVNDANEIVAYVPNKISLSTNCGRDMDGNYYKLTDLTTPELTAEELEGYALYAFEDTYAVFVKAGVDENPNEIYHLNLLTWEMTKIKGDTFVQKNIVNGEGTTYTTSQNFEAVGEEPARTEYYLYSAAGELIGTYNTSPMVYVYDGTVTIWTNGKTLFYA